MNERHGMAALDCPCCSNKPFGRCCEPYLVGKANPKTVKQLMRSRYSAYALGDYGEYLLATWHPQTAPQLSADALSARELQWLSLEILAYSQQGDAGTVEFQARFKEPDGTRGTHHEVSRFLRVAGKWLYLDERG